MGENFKNKLFQKDPLVKKLLNDAQFLKYKGSKDELSFTPKFLKKLGRNYKCFRANTIRTTGDIYRSLVDGYYKNKHELEKAEGYFILSFRDTREKTPGHAMGFKINESKDGKVGITVFDPNVESPLIRTLKSWLGSPPGFEMETPATLP